MSLEDNLLIHYPLNHQSGGQKNLLPCGNLYTRNSPWTTTLNRTDGYAFVSRSAFEATPGKTYTISVQCDGTLSSGHSAGGIPISEKPWSFWAYISNVDTTANWRNGGYDTPKNLSTTSNNYRKIGNTHVWTITLTSTQKYIGLRTNSYSDGSTDVTINWWNMKVEEGDVFTGWSSYGSIVGQYDSQTYTESDGSEWVRVAHHNNPASGSLFASSDTFSTGVYKDENRWYDIESICVQLPKFEFMVKQKTTSDATEVKYRWIQNKSPLESVYADVAPSAVTRITTTGYTDGGFGGIYKIGSRNTRMVIANTSNGNWYGAFGSWTAYQGGIPGYPNTTVTTGYMDLYVRTDNLYNIEYDISGFNNNGTRVGAFNWTSDSPKYEVSACFNGSEYISSNSLGSGILTLSAWVKTSKNKSTSQFVVADSESQICISFYSGCIIGYYGPSGSQGTGSKCTLGTSYRENGWNHIVVVKTGTGTRTVYCNGVEQTPTSNDYWTSTGADFLVGKRAVDNSPLPFYGWLSDIRAYSKALSASDVLELYKNSRYYIENNN